MTKFTVGLEQYLTVVPKPIQYAVRFGHAIIADGFPPNDMGKAKANYLANQLNNTLEKFR